MCVLDLHFYKKGSRSCLGCAIQRLELAFEFLASPLNRLQLCDGLCQL